MDGTSIGWLALPLAILGGAIRVSTPFIFVSIGELITEKSGRINLGLEGTLMLGAMAGYAISYLSGSPWLGVLSAGLAGMTFGLLHGLLCSVKRVNDTAIGISLIVLGTGLAFFLGKPLIEPKAPPLPSIALGFWSSVPQVRAALDVNALFFVGIALAFAVYVFLNRTGWGLMLRTVGDSEDAARALGFPVLRVRIIATMAGGFLAGIGGSFLSLSYPGSWSEGLSSGQGIMAVALVIFARWRSINALGASLLFGGAGALGPALQGIGMTGYYYLFNAAPYILTLAIMVASTSRAAPFADAPGELKLHR
ncbi:ABC transporter permease [Bradyrhizobium sp. CCBAU 53415]|uniref:ABC transporter permease n=1 Tax=Bradyrhizobium sp. CCBAU 53415 TaxID=1325119 RepID=UPI002306C596|nr:ABC transporter permease [Bradyrhizobium sp. CCBAU 53415]MDA9467094.1 ABC transporter permease [Bradyrhizobium sp. CCBAU 53415]